MCGFITKVQHFSVHDGPGIRTTVFFKGCSLSCIWCQNPETVACRAEIMRFSEQCICCKRCIETCPKGCFSWNGGNKFNSDECDQCGLCVDACPVGALRWSSYKVSADEILNEVMRDKVYYDCSGGGITLSGGEPLHQIDFCCDIASSAKTLGLHVAVDTSGYVLQEVFERAMPFIDLFLYDIKFVDRGLHERYTGQPNDLILDNFKRLCLAKKEIVVRVPLIPGMTDTKENLSQIEEFIKSCAEGIKIDYIPCNLLMEQKYNMLGRESPVKAGLKDE